MAYKLTHPDSDHTIEVEKHMVTTYQSQGWETAPTAKTPAKPAADE